MSSFDLVYIIEGNDLRLSGIDGDASPPTPSLPLASVKAPSATVTVASPVKSSSAWISAWYCVPLETFDHGERALNQGQTVRKQNVTCLELVAAR